jgi:hypothetical protein
MIKNFFKKFAEIWLQGLFINGQNQASVQQSQREILNKVFSK